MQLVPSPQYAEWEKYYSHEKAGVKEEAEWWC